MKKVTAKFQCTEKIERVGGKEIKFTADHGENSDFTKYTPYGEILMGISIDSKADKLFNVGKYYHLIFEPVD